MPVLCVFIAPLVAALTLSMAWHGMIFSGYTLALSMVEQQHGAGWCKTW